MNAVFRIGFFLYALNLLGGNLFPSGSLLGEAVPGGATSAEGASSSLPIAIVRKDSLSPESGASCYSSPSWASPLRLKNASSFLLRFDETRLRRPYSFLMAVLEILEEDERFFQLFELCAVFKKLQGPEFEVSDDIWGQFHKTGFLAQVKKRILVVNEEIRDAADIGILGTSLICGERMLENKSSILQRNLAVIKIIEELESKFEE